MEEDCHGAILAATYDYDFPLLRRVIFETRLFSSSIGRKNGSVVASTA